MPPGNAVGRDHIDGARGVAHSQQESLPQRMFWRGVLRADFLAHWSTALPPAMRSVFSITRSEFNMAHATASGLRR